MTGWKSMVKKLGRINVRKLKAFALESMPNDHPLRSILSAEEDEIDAAIFLARLKIWLQLCSIKR
jgi:hypothetical protein